jgi:hypothetical protein
MSTKFCSDIEHLVSNNFNEISTVNLIEDADSRFSFLVSLAGFSLIIIGSDARVCLRIKVSDCDELIKSILISAVYDFEADTRAQLNPYALTLWKNRNSNYRKFPNAKSLLNEKDAYIEICTGPVDIIAWAKSEVVIRNLLLTAMEWITSYRFDDNEGAVEGNSQVYLQTKIERSGANRRRCIAIFGVACQICKIVLSDRYGELAGGFIHVHHIESIARGGPRWIDPSRDLIPVCPNCHSMLHRQDPPLSPDKLRQIIEVKVKDNL